MRYVVLCDAKPGMRLAYDLFDSYGNVLLWRDSELNESNIKKLINQGFGGVYILDDFSSDIEIKTPITQDLKRRGMDAVRSNDVDECKIVSDEIAEYIIEHGIVSMDMADLRTYDDCTFVHSVNVSVIACEIGMGLKLSKEDLSYLTLAALVHDIGKLKIPIDILNKPDRLTGDEYRIMQSHVNLSYAKVKDRNDLSEEAKLAVLYHHENVDGSGYPYGLDDTELNLMSKIIHVADVYDALVSQRPYKSAYAPSEAIEYLMGGCGIMFDKLVVETLLRYVPIYPKGMQVNLSNNFNGLILENTHYHNLRPLIKLMDGTLLDLTESKNLSITISDILPYSIAKAMESEVERKQMVRDGNIRYKIVICGKDVENMLMLQNILKEKYDVEIVHRGDDLIACALRADRPDMIISDVELLDSSGIDVARRINQLSKQSIPIMFVTEKQDKETVLACKDVGAVGYVIKPYKSVFLKTEVKRVLTGINDTY